MRYQSSHDQREKNRDHLSREALIDLRYISEPKRHYKGLPDTEMGNYNPPQRL